MGHQNNTNINYITLATNQLEEKIRAFEINVLLNSEEKHEASNQEKSFGSIYSQICIYLRINRNT